MSLESTGFKKTQKPIPSAEQHVAICYAIIDLGKQKEQFGNQEPTFVNKVQFCFEFPNLPLVVFDEKKGPQPHAIFQSYTVSAGEKAKLPKMLCSWGKMDIKKLTGITNDLLKMFLGQPCMIQVEHNASKKDTDANTGQPIIYANIGLAGVSVLPFASNLGIARPAGTKNPLVFFSMDHFTWDSYNKLADPIKKIISESQDWPGILAKYGANPVTAQQQTSIEQPAVQQTAMSSATGANETVHSGPISGPSF